MAEQKDIKELTKDIKELTKDVRDAEAFNIDALGRENLLRRSFGHTRVGRSGRLLPQKMEQLPQKTDAAGQFLVIGIFIVIGIEYFIYSQMREG